MSQELEIPSEKSFKSASEIISDLKNACEEGVAAGYVFAVIDGNGAVVPFIGGRNLGEVLLMQKIVDKEVDRIISSSIGQKEA